MLWLHPSQDLRRLITTQLSHLLRDHPILQSEVVLFVALFISVICGSAAVLLHEGILTVAHMIRMFGSGLDSTWYPWLVICAPAVGGLIAGLILQYLTPQARGSGIPQVKLDLAMRGGVIPFKVALGKLVTTTLAVGSGGSVGREGPTVQMCASLGSSLARWFPLTTAQLRIMVHTACVSGLAAAFNTPIAGVTFIMEEVIGDLNTRHLSYLILAAIGATITTRIFLGDAPLFDVPAYALGHPIELGLYILLGVLSGLLSVALIRLLIWSINRFQTLSIPEFLKPALGGLLVGFMALQLPQVLGIGYQAVTDAMQNRLPLLLMLLLTVGKFIATILSYSSGTAGGLFSPALFIGAMLGGSLAAGVDTFTPLTIASPGAFALVGMGAVFVGIIRTPITSILIIFEMTNDYALILPLMLANMTSYSIARVFEPHNVYEAILAANNVHLPSGQDHVLLEDLTAEEAMDRQPLTVRPETPVADVVTLLEQNIAHGVPVVTPDQCLLGVVTLTDVRQIMRQEQHDKPVESIATTRHLISVHPDHTLNWAMQQMGAHEVSLLPVVTRGETERLVGVLTMADIVRAYAHKKMQ
jgi:CIC family chloride channel protein